MIGPIEIGAVIAPIISALGVTLLYHYLGRDYLGADENKIWNEGRRKFLGGFDQYVRDNSTFALTNTARPGEYVGTVDVSSGEVAQALEDSGYVQGVLAGLKTRTYEDEEQFESGSMVFRESKSDLLPDALAFHQNHVFWFDNGKGGIDVYAHYEYSSANPVVAWPHYRAVGQDFEQGKANTRKVLKGAGLL